MLAARLTDVVPIPDGQRLELLRGLQIFAARLTAVVRVSDGQCLEVMQSLPLLATLRP